jgi:hypothetical protein
MKKVHDILVCIVDDTKILSANGKEQKHNFPVAFIQWGNPEDGFQYEAVCPFCAKSIGWVIGPETYRDLMSMLAMSMAAHYTAGCPRFGASTLDVEVARFPIGTEKPPIVN